MRPRHACSALVLVSAMILACCAGRTPATAPSSRPSERQTTSATAAATTALPPAPLDAGLPPTASTEVVDAATVREPEPVSYPATLAGNIRCGGHVCHVGKEVCCVRNGVPEPYCAPLRELEADTAQDPGQLCGSPSDGEAWGGLVQHCDEATDCRRGQRCCARPTHWSGIWHSAECQAAAAGRCGVFEVCTPGSACAGGGTCVDRRCTMPPARVAVQCDKQTCRGTTPVCCDRNGTLTCTGSQRQCASTGGGALRCTSNSDCLPLERCVLLLNGGSECTGLLINTAAGHDVLCRSDDDCGSFYGQGQARCLRDPDLHGDTLSVPLIHGDGYCR